MYKETVKPVGKTIFFVIGIIGGALLLTGIVDALIAYFNLPYKSLYQLAFLIAVAVGVYILVRNVVSEYVYSIVDNEFLITSKLGSNEQLVAHIYIDSIELIAFHSSAALGNIKCDGRYNAKKSLVSSQTYICVFTQDGKRYKLKFEPSDKLLDIMGKKGVRIEK